MSSVFNVSGKLVITSQQAMTLPKLAAAPGSPVSGDMYYNTTTNVVQIYSNSAWGDVAIGVTGANTTLSNLGTTAINTDLIFASASSSGIYAANALIPNALHLNGGNSTDTTGTDNGGDININPGNAPTGNYGGNINLNVGTGPNSNGNIFIGGNIKPMTSATYSLGNSNNYFDFIWADGVYGRSQMGLKDGNTTSYGINAIKFQAAGLVTPSGSSTDIVLRGPDKTATTDGTIPYTGMTIMTLNDSAVDAIATLPISIETGNKTAGTGNSGDLNLQTGTSIGGTVGNVNIKAGDTTDTTYTKNGGSVSIESGSANLGLNGGDISLITGYGDGIPGNIALKSRVPGGALNPNAITIAPWNQTITGATNISLIANGGLAGISGTTGVGIATTAGTIALTPGTGSYIDATTHQMKNLVNGTSASQDAATVSQVETLVAGAGVGTFIPLSQKGAANGVAGLDSGGKVPAAQLPSTLMNFKGAWDASTNTPTLADGTGTAGDVYRASVVGTASWMTDTGPKTFGVGDFIIYNGTVWQHSPASDAVISVNGYTGAVTLTKSDIGLSNVDNTSDANKPVSTATQTALNLKADLASPTFTGTVSGITKTMVGLSNVDNVQQLPLSYLDTDGTLAANSDSKVASQKAVKTYVDTGLSGKANTTLSNLGTTAINADLLPATTDTKNLGSSSLEFSTTYTNHAVVSTDIKIGSASTPKLVFNQPLQATLAASTSTFTNVAALFDSAVSKSCEVLYEVTDGTEVRAGIIMVVSNGTNVGFYDTNTATGLIATLEFTAVLSSTNVVLQFKGTTGACTMKIAQRNIL